MKKVYLAGLIPFCLSAQDLTQLINESLQNQLVESSKYNIQSIKDTLSSTQKGYLPKLTVGVQYSDTNKETVSVPDSSTVSSANISYLLYDGGKKETLYNALDANIKGANENLNSLKNSLALQVVNYYFNYQSLLCKKEAVIKEIDTLKAEQTRLKRFFEAGTATSDEVDKITSRVQSANVTLHETELQLQTILHNLEYLTVNKVDIEKGSTIKELQKPKPLLRSDIKALEYDMQAQIETAKGEKSADYPSVTLNNTYSYYDMDYDNRSLDSGLEEQNIFSVNFSWNLYDFGSTQKSYESAYKQYQGIRSRYEYEKNKANVDLKLARKSYEIGKLKILSADAALKAANSTYEVIEAKYRNGLVDNVAYLEALSEKFSALSALKTAKFDLEIKKADIIYHSGEDIWEYVK